MADADEESIYDSEDDFGNDAMDIDVANPNNVNVNEPISDSEDGSVISLEHPITDSEDDDDDDDFGNWVQDLNRDTFTLNFPELDELLNGQGGNLPAREKFILIIAQMLRFKQNYKSMLFSFKMANRSFNNANFPRNMDQFWTMVNRRRENLTSITVCTICWVSVGEKRPTENCICGECGPGRRNTETGTYLYINLASQIEGILRKPGIERDLQYPYTRRKRNNDAIEDIYDGNVYRHHSAEGQFLHQGNHNYSLAMWADGVSPVKTANVTILPVFIQILELSPRARQRHSLLSAVYVGPRKPQMALFLTPVMTELRDLQINGVTWRANANEERISRFMLLIVSADSEERYKILGMTRHNGHFGCTFCYVDGVRIENGNHLIYPIANELNVIDRTNEEIRAAAREANLTGITQRGVQELSALNIIPNFDLRIAQLVEPMHNSWEGNYLRLQKNFKNPQRPHAIPAPDLSTISIRIVSIRTPTKLSRYPRRLEHLEKFTGTELRNNAWYYWLPCAQEFLHELQLELSALFAEATFIMNKDSILPHELDHAEQHIDQYRQLFQDVFPQEEWVYNLHLLKHSIRCVRDLGPAWVASGFWFESLNRQIINYMTSPNDRAWQIACRILLMQMIEKCLDQQLTPETRNDLRELIGKGQWNVPPNVVDGTSIQVDEDGRQGFFNDQQINVLREAGYVNVERQRPMTMFKKIYVDGVTYQVRNERLTKYNNSIAHIHAQHLGDLVDFIEIHSIVRWYENGLIQNGIFGAPFHTIEPAFGTTYMKVVEKFDDLVYVRLTDVVTPGVLVEANERTYISRLPNRWDND